MKMKIYGLKNCDNCRKARKALDEAELVDLRETALEDALLAAAFEKFGTALVNTRSTTWRGLSEEERQLDPIELIKQQPSVMKRPLIVFGDRMSLGWDSKAREMWIPA